MIHLLTIIGARPQIIKAAALSRAIRNRFSDRINETLVHTGQHYDENMSKVFFEEMDIPEPDVNLEVGSGTHARQTAMMMEKLETVLLKGKPDFVVVYGDTNSTLAGSVTAAKLHIPVVHIEAGLRSFNKSMPEEINRIVCDHTSTLLFTPTQSGIQNLIREGFDLQAQPPYTPDNPGIFHCGDVMYDNSLYFSSIATDRSNILEEYGLIAGNYLLCTVHRDHNTDDPERLTAIFSSLQSISSESATEIVLPLHPRTFKLLEQNVEPLLLESIHQNPRIKLIPPVSYFDVIVLENNCELVLTDSGGLQKEAYFFKKPVIVLRPETEWVEIIEQGAGIVCDVDPVRIRKAYHHFKNTPGLEFPPLFGDGKAAEFICEKICEMQL